MQEIEKRVHVTEEMWIALERNTICQQDYMKILEHTCDCTWCAERMANVLEQDDAAVEPPSYLKKQILERTEQLDVQAIVTVRQTSKRLQLLLYSLKVSAAVVLSILILGVTANFQDVGFTQLELPGQEISSESNDFTEVTEKQEAEKKETVMELVNRAAYGVTDKMNTFADQLLNGGK